MIELIDIYRERRKQMNYLPAAGVVILKEHEDGDHDVVCLITHTGMIDLTKGIIDPGENPLQTALREAQEEASITNLDFKFGDTPLTHDATTMYVAETDQEPEVQRNPHSGLFEHRSTEMIPLKDLVDDPRLLEYLRPAVEYAYELVYSKPPM